MYGNDSPARLPESQQARSFVPALPLPLSYIFVFIGGFLGGIIASSSQTVLLLAGVPVLFWRLLGRGKTQGFSARIIFAPLLIFLAPLVFSLGEGRALAPRRSNISTTIQSFGFAPLPLFPPPIHWQAIRQQDGGAGLSIRAVAPEYFSALQVHTHTLTHAYTPTHTYTRTYTQFPMHLLSQTPRLCLVSKEINATSSAHHLSHHCPPFNELVQLRLLLLFSIFLFLIHWSHPPCLALWVFSDSFLPPVRPAIFAVWIKKKTKKKTMCFRKIWNDIYFKGCGSKSITATWDWTNCVAVPPSTPLSLCQCHYFACRRLCSAAKCKQTVIGALNRALVECTKKLWWYLFCKFTDNYALELEGKKG